MIKKVFVLLLGPLLLVSVKIQALVILQYHHISEKTPPATSTSPSLFAEHMRYLHSHNYKVVSILELKEALLSRKSLPDRTVVVTFDDGYRSIFNTAYPILKKYRFPFTIFINTQPHDQQNQLYASWQELKTMAQNGAVIANHTDSHPHLIRNYKNLEPKAWNEQRLREVFFAEKRIKNNIGESHKLFAYPYGEYDRTLTEVLARNGYVAFTQQSGPVSYDSSPQMVPRFPMGGNFGEMQDFITKINSLPLPTLKTLVTDGRGQTIKNPELPQNVSIPELRLSTPLVRFIKNFNCYATGQGLIETTVHSGTVVAKARHPLPAGRSRYNCTANAGNGRFYWYSQMFIRREANGRWYRE